jgi:hypothetical protein
LPIIIPNTNATKYHPCLLESSRNCAEPNLLVKA